MKHEYTLAGLLLVVLVSACGCVPPLQDRLASEDPKVRAAAVYEVCQADGQGAERALIRLLADEDEGVRFFASAGLYRLTGQRLSYEAQGRLGERAESIGRWVTWYATKYPDDKDGCEDLKRLLESPGAEEPQDDKNRDE